MFKLSSPVGFIVNLSNNTHTQGGHIGVPSVPTCSWQCALTFVYKHMCPVCPSVNEWVYFALSSPGQVIIWDDNLASMQMSHPEKQWQMTADYSCRLSCRGLTLGNGNGGRGGEEYGNIIWHTHASCWEETKKSQIGEGTIFLEMSLLKCQYNSRRGNYREKQLQRQKK